jgi:hypothetical protein
MADRKPDPDNRRTGRRTLILLAAGLAVAILFLGFGIWQGELPQPAADILEPDLDLTETVGTTQPADSLDE